MYGTTMQLHKTASRTEESFGSECRVVSRLDFFICLVVILKFSKPAVHVFYMGNTNVAI